MSTSSPAKPRRTRPSPSPLGCTHSPTAILDLLFLIPLLFSSAFLVLSSFSHILHSLLLLLLPSPFLLLPLLLLPLLFLLPALRKCRRPGCKGMRDAVEFDVQVQTEESVRAEQVGVWREIEGIPWKGGGSGDSPDYECVRKELRRMAPVNGRAVLLFRGRCGCAVSKLEGWGPKKGRRHKSGSLSIKSGAN